MKKNTLIVLPLLLLMPAVLVAQPKQEEAAKPEALALLAVAVILAFAILIAGSLLLKQAKTNLTLFKKVQAKKVAAMLILCCVSGGLFAQDASSAGEATGVVDSVVRSLSQVSFFGLMSVIGLELIVLLVLLAQLRSLMVMTVEVEESPATGSAVGILRQRPSFDWKCIWQKLNRFKPIREEADIDLGHDYDGIRELDNRLPPWWLYGFYLCIIVACIYLWRYHVSHSGPSQLQELEYAMKEAAEQKEAYLANAKNNVNENTVVLLTDATDLEAGKGVFTSTCAACHAADGGGGVGPNLTDAYWLHGGSVQEVFKSIKYGWPEKGMKSWKDDFSPMQIAQVASYVKSLYGTKPATPKEPQGVLFETTGDPKVDSVEHPAAAERVNQ